MKSSNALPVNILIMQHLIIQQLSNVTHLELMIMMMKPTDNLAGLRKVY